MLIQLQIRNFVIIDELDLLFEPGMSVLTGETGAGKSILIDALGQVLGDKAETSMIRDTQDRAEIVAIFSVANIDAIRRILDEQAISAEEELILRRVISRDGRSRAFVNSSPVPIQLLKTLGEQLIDIHGQHAHQSLMNRNTQRALLDSHAGHRDELAAVNAAWQDWQTLSRQLAQSTGGSGDNETAISLLQYQVQELDELNLAEDEYVRLEEEFRRLDNVSRLQQTAGGILASLNESELSAAASIHHAVRELRDILKFDPALGQVIELLDTASIQLGEAVSELKACTNRFEADPARLDTISRRLDLLHDTARKHHINVQQLAIYRQQLQERLDQILNARDAVNLLSKEQIAALARYQQAAVKLSASRQKAAKSMAKEVSARLQGLGMPEGRFLIDITAGDPAVPQQGGNDQIEFLVSMNPGQAPQPLRKVASGGELSRISLAIQIISKDEHGIPTLIFDEVDAGIGGGIAEIVGKLLRDLSRHHQVFCVTHLAQVASQGHHHFQVSKQTAAHTTRVEVIPLRGNDRVDEIARMLGGVKISEKTRAHAKEMLAELAKA